MDFLPRILPQSRILPAENPVKQIHRYRQHLQSGFIILCLGILFFLVIWSYMGSQKKNPALSIPLPQHHKGLDKATQTTSMLDFGISPDEWARMQQAVYWADPDRPITSLSMCTSPTNTTFSILGLRESYQVGDELTVTVVAKDYKDKQKQYGGDFFQAKLFSSNLKASVYGEVLDHENGTYSARFLLPWAGQAQVAVRMIHSSEAVQVLKRHRQSDSDRVFFWGFYEGPGLDGTKKSESVKCNVKWDKNGLERLKNGNCCCEYRDPRTGEEWRCQRPQTLPCNTLVYHSMGGYQNPLTAFEKKLMDMKLTDRGINGDKRIVTILPSNASFGVAEKCRPGMPTPVPAGFYLKDVWTSLVCATRHFTIPDAVQCLKDKHIYMMGDSTMRQWFDYLVQAIPTLKRMNLHSSFQVGPLMAVDVDNNIDLHWRAHGLPLRSRKSPVTDVHYISNEIDDLAGGPHMVIVFNLGPHFTTFPLAFFARRVARIRRAVVALLRRAPQTTIIIKTVNTSYKDVFGSDWFSVQLDRILREAFKDIKVFILDVWQMTACHYLKENIHPKPVIIRNEMDIFLSFVCPE